MASFRTFFILFLLVFPGIMACKMDNPIIPDSTSGSTSADTTGNRLRIRVGRSLFTATLQTNATVAAFKARLPLTIPMRELNGNEKYGQLLPDLPTNAANPGTIKAGDLMLYGSSTLVLFYETFRTSYSYTKLGQIDNPAGLAAALGSGNVTVTFERE